jgi:hypothetical protein
MVAFLLQNWLLETGRRFPTPDDFQLNACPVFCKTRPITDVCGHTA